MSVATTFAPSRTHHSTWRRPIPCPAPVTTTDFPTNDSTIVLLPGISVECRGSLSRPELGEKLFGKCVRGTRIRIFANVKEGALPHGDRETVDLVVAASTRHVGVALEF